MCLFTKVTIFSKIEDEYLNIIWGKLRTTGHNPTKADASDSDIVKCHLWGVLYHLIVLVSYVLIFYLLSLTGIRG